MVKNTMLNRLNELPRLSKVLISLMWIFISSAKKSRWIKS